MPVTGELVVRDVPLLFSTLLLTPLVLRLSVSWYLALQQLLHYSKEASELCIALHAQRCQRRSQRQFYCRLTLVTLLATICSFKILFLVYEQRLSKHITARGWCL